MTDAPTGPNWFGTGIGIGALGVVMVLYYAFYWGLLGLWTPGPLLPLTLAVLAAPLLLIAIGIVLLVRRNRVGFLLVTAVLAWLLVLGFNESWAATSGLVSQVLLAVGAGVSLYGFFAART